jgi:hypothetical protein
MGRTSFERWWLGSTAVLLLAAAVGCDGGGSTATDAAEDAGDAADPDAPGEDGVGEDGAGDDADTDSGPRRPHGDPCTSDRQCAGGVCVDESLDPSFVGGYCTAIFCDPFFAAACGDGAVCFDTEVFPPLCARTCGRDEDCRLPDYVCVGSCIPDDFTTTLERPGVLTGAETPIAAFLAAVDDDRMMARVRILAGEEAWAGPAGPVTIRSRARAHPDHAVALDYLEAELAALAPVVRRLPSAGGTLVNLEAEFPGTVPALAPVLVTAHYDSTASDTPGWTAATDPAPGAVDNGSGAAVALEAASILAVAAEPPPRTVRIVLLDAEEEGLLGSEAYASALAAAGEPVGCVINPDMIGWTAPPTPDRFWYVFSAASRPWAALGVEAIDLFVPDARPIASDYEDAGNSDGASFWAEGYCAINLSCWPRLRSNHRTEDTSSEFRPAVFAATSRATLAVAAAWMYATEDP